MKAGARAASALACGPESSRRGGLRTGCARPCRVAPELPGCASSERLWSACRTRMRDIGTASRGGAPPRLRWTAPAPPPARGGRSRNPPRPRGYSSGSPAADKAARRSSASKTPPPLRPPSLTRTAESAQRLHREAFRMHPSASAHFKLGSNGAVKAQGHGRPQTLAPGGMARRLKRRRCGHQGASTSAVPSRATMRPRLTTSLRGGRAATASARLSASTSTKSAWQPGARP